MRRITFALLVVTTLVVGAVPAVSAPSPQGALNSAFNTWFTGSEAVVVATFDRGGSAWFRSATSAFVFDTFDIPGEPNSGIGAVRLSPVPGSPSGPFCDSNTFGIWVVVFGSLDFLEPLVGNQVLSLSGEPLDAMQTPIKPIFDPYGFYQDELDSNVWFSFGVPVYGALDPGFHEVLYESDEFVVSNTVEVQACP